MKNKVCRWISAALAGAICLTLICAPSVSAEKPGTVTQYFVDGTGAEISEPVVDYYDDYEAVYIEQFDGYEYLSCDIEIKYTYCKATDSYVQGYVDRTFKPNNSLTRAEAAKMLAQFVDAESGGAKLPSDIISGKWYYKAVSELFNAGHLAGYPDGTFRPDSTMTRAEFTKLIVSLGEVTGIADVDFKDVPRSNWAYNYINTAAAAGLITGYDGYIFQPDKEITRAEAVTIINRLYEYPTHYAIVPEESPYKDVATEFWAYDDIMVASDNVEWDNGGSDSYYYYDEDGFLIGMMFACFITGRTGPYIEGYRCIGLSYTLNYHYKSIE